MRFRTISFLAVLVVMFLQVCPSWAGAISGELKTWHKVTITFDGPDASERGTPNPFLDYNLTVTFTHQSGRSYVVPGCFAADGNAAITSAECGNKWRVHLAPDAAGRWSWTVSFRQGENVAVDADAPSVPWAPLDGQRGSFVVGPTDKTGRDHRGKGRLQYVGGHFLRFAGTGEYFLKAGADAPENLLAYEDFDDTPNKGNHRKSWAPHAHDFDPAASDLLWGPDRDKGKNLLGAIRYLSDKGMNAFSFLTFNVDGDDQNVFPHLFLKDMADYESSTGKAAKGNGWSHHVHHTRFNVSKMDQWERVFEYGDRMGMYLHFKTLETENELLLDGGDLGPERKLYYRELIARFAHHLALNWNLGEEINDATHEQKVAWANYFWTQDPYRHHIVIHNMGDPHYDLLGDASALTGFSLQTSRPDFSEVHQRVLDYLRRSAAAGKPWVVACDEPGDAQHALVTDAEDPTRDDARKNALWGVFMAGGAGIEWYFGYKHPHSDLTCQDWRTRDKMWDQSRYCIEFFQRHEIPFWEMKNDDDLTRNPDDYCFVKPGELYLIYFKNPGELTLSLEAGAFTYGWFDPKTGNGLEGLLEPGQARAPGQITLKTPGEGDWLLCLQKTGPTPLSFQDVTEIPISAAADTAAEDVPSDPYALVAIRDFQAVEDAGFAPFYRDSGRQALAIHAGRHKDRFSAARTTFAGESGTYHVTLTTLTETDGESTYRLLVGGRTVGTYTNPATDRDYQPTHHTWRDVAIQKDDIVRIEFNTASNQKLPEGTDFAYARGRWTKLVLEPAGPTRTVFEEHDGLVAGEAELFFEQTHTEKRRWYVTTPEMTPAVEPDGDGNHAASASGQAYIEVLPDTRRTHADKLIHGENFTNEPGTMAIVSYQVYFNTPGRYYVWVRAYSTGSEDNGLHVGLNGAWPESGRRLQWCEGKNSWRWDSKQRTEAEHCGEPYKIYLDIEKPGLHTISFSMREDGFEFDKWLMTTDREMKRPLDEGPALRFRRIGGAS